MDSIKQKLSEMELPAPARIGKNMVSMAKGLDNGRKWLVGLPGMGDSPLAAADWIDPVLDSIRLVGALLVTQQNLNTKAEAGNTKGAVRERDYGLILVVVSKAVAAITAFALGIYIASSAILRLAGSETKLPSPKIFAYTRKIPGGVMGIYSLRYTAGSKDDAKKEIESARGNSLKERRVAARYGGEVLGLVKKGAGWEEISSAIDRQWVNSHLDIAEVVGLMTELVLEQLGHSEAAKLVAKITDWVGYGQTAWDTYHLARQHGVLKAPGKIATWARGVVSKGDSA